MSTESADMSTESADPSDFDYDVQFYGEAEVIHATYDDFYYPDETTEPWEEGEKADFPQLDSIFELCIKPTLHDGLSHVAILILWCFIFRITTQITKIPKSISHLFSAGAGVMVLYHFFALSMFYIIGFALGAYLVLFAVSYAQNKHRGPILGIVCIVFLMICELFFVKPSEWHKIRGAQMVVAMKVISVAFDTDSGTLPVLPSLIEFMGYTLCVGTCVFGPWIPYKDYVAIYNRPAWSRWWMLRVVLSGFLAFLFLTLSVCWLQWLIPDDSWRWWVAYRDALSFRSSHYFISYVSEASALLCGIGNSDQVPWSFAVAKPHHIEVPRSLVQVVVYWNMPMHNWLKIYVFRTTTPFGNFLSVFSTYAVSALLHGLNFQLAAVLLSLGGYTYIEYVVRLKFSMVYNACVLVRPCRKDCSHRNKHKKGLVMFANVCLGLLAMFHLSYLGVMFDMSSKLQEEGYNYTHTLKKWQSLGYTSHWVCLGSYLVFLLV